MTEFNKMLDWKILAGSHEFPGPDGGTCINEAAIIVAGFEYKKVSSWQDCPPWLVCTLLHMPYYPPM